MGNLSAMIRPPPDGKLPQHEYISYYALYRNFVATGGLAAFLASSITSYAQDLLLNWKRSKQSLSINYVELYALLDLSNNRLSGRIPALLGNLEHLNSLNLSHNHLSWDIPSTLGNLKNVEVLDLSHNELSDEIPASFAKLLQLDILDLSNNHLTGRIPDSPQLDRLNDPMIYANNSGICGLQIQVPCSSPPSPPPKAPQASPQENESKEAIFSWEIAVIVCPISFIGTVALVYSSGYFYRSASFPEKALVTLLRRTNISVFRSRKQCRGVRVGGA